jgi:hypothetical protein
MKKLTIAAIVLTSVLSVSPAEAPTAQAATTTTTIALPLVSPRAFAQWGQVAWCETHSNWSREGSLHDGGLGFLQSTWEQFGGLKFAARPHLATPEQQIYVAINVEAQTGHEGYVPDTDGRCHAW